MVQLGQDYPTQIKIRIMAGQVWAASGVSMWCFAPDRTLYYSTCPNEDEYLTLLKINGCLDYLFSEEKGWNKPVILSDSIGLLWIGETFYESDERNPDLEILLGPFFSSQTSVNYIADELRKRIDSIKLQRDTLRSLEIVPVLHTSVVNLYAKMLHFTITDDMISEEDFYYQKSDLDFTDQSNDYNEIEFTSESQYATGKTSKDDDRAIDVEQQILLAVREGNLNYKVITEQASNVGEGFLTATGSALRDGKNSLIILNALCSRAAVEGGLPLQTAREVEGRYNKELEKRNSFSELSELKNKMLYEYIKRVHDGIESGQISREIRECCDYIRANTHKELSVDQLAKDRGYTTYYFSKKFFTETGIRINDFIKQARIDQAKIALITTNRSVQDISDSLHFGNRNYFSRIFKEVTGISPAAFRDQKGGI